MSQNAFVLKEATLYSAFRRLEENQLITSYWGDEDSGARRRYYSITERGSQLYDENQKDWDRIESMVKKLIYA